MQHSTLVVPYFEINNYVTLSVLIVFSISLHGEIITSNLVQYCHGL